jgi:hypothetical protein
MRSSLSRADPLVRGRRPRRLFRAEMKLRWLDEVRGVLRTAMGSKNHRGRGGWQGAVLSHSLRSKERSHECERCTHECARHNTTGREAYRT